MKGLEQPNRKDAAASLYRERAFEYIDKVARNIKKIISGEIKKIDLNEEEKDDLFRYESQLGEKLEKIHALRPQIMTLYLNFFATDKGKARLKEFTGLELKSSDPTEIEKFLYKNGDALTRLAGDKRDELSGETIRYADQKLLNDLCGSRNENGEIDINRLDIPAPQRFQLTLRPEEALEKVAELRKFKKIQIIEGIEEMRKGPSSNNLEIAKLEILEMYRRKVNVMIMEQYKFGILAFKKKMALSTDGLPKTESKLLDQFSGLLSPQRNRARIDRMFYGASEDFDEKGMHVQIPDSLVAYAEQMAEAGERAILARSEQIRQKGLDEKKLFAKDIDPYQRAAWHEEILAAEGMLSDYPSDTFDPNRGGPAPDNKWQHALRPNRTTMKLGETLQKVLLDSDKAKSSIYGALAVACGHENVHILRVENMSKVPLRLMQKIGGTRIAALSEGGSMHIQNKICESIFGFSDLPHSHYVRAMIKKMKGGNYLECVKAFYESSLAVTRKKLKDGLTDKASFEKETAAKLGEAINRSKRLFADGISFESDYPYLTDSRSTVYLEQKYLLEKLEEMGLQKLSFVGGVDLDDLQTLLRLGLLDFGDIKEYDMGPVLKIWDRENPKYLLDKAA